MSIKIVIGDNDPPGVTLGKNRAVLFGANLYFPPEPYKVLDEWILADQEGAVQQLKAWGAHTMANWY